VLKEDPTKAWPYSHLTQLLNDEQTLHSLPRPMVSGDGRTSTSGYMEHKVHGFIMSSICPSAHSVR